MPVKLQNVPLTLLKWLEAPTVSRVLGYAILEELEQEMEVLPREPEDPVEIQQLRWRPSGRARTWKKVE